MQATITPEMARAELERRKSSSSGATITPEMARAELERRKAAATQSPENDSGADKELGYFGQLKQDLSKDYQTAKAIGRGAVEGALDLGRGVEQLYLGAGEKIGLLPEGSGKKYRDEVNKIKAEYKELPYIKENPWASGGGEIIGQVLTTLPASALSIPMRAAQVAKAAPGAIGKVVNALTSNTARNIGTGALQGAGMGALQYDPTGEERLGNIMGGAGIGAAIPGGISAAKGVYDLTKSTLNRNAIDLSEDVAKQAKQRLQEAKSIGIDQLSAGALMRDPNIQAKEELLIKGSNSPAAAQLRKSYEDTEKQLYDAAQRIIKTLGGKVKNSAAIGNELQTTERAIYSNAQEKISTIYDAAKSAPGGDALIPADNILTTYNNILEDFVDVKFSPAIKKTIESLTKKPVKESTADLVNAGAIDASGNALKAADEIVQPIQFTVGEANNFIKKLNAASRNTSNVESKAAINILKQKVFESIDTLADDATNPAKDLFQAARQARKELGDVFNQKDIVETIRKKKAQYTDYIDPERVVNRINTLEDWNKIEKSLKFKDAYGAINQEGLQAWDNLRATKLNDFFENATTDVNGQLQLNLNKLVNNYKKISQPVMKKIIGDDKVFKEFNTLIKVMGYWKNKAPGTVNTSNSANVINRLAERGLGILDKIPFVSQTGYMLKKFFQDAADSKWVEDNLAIGRGKLPKTPEKPVTKPIPGQKLLPIAAASMATRASLPEQENTP
jgi:hypothetical protein